MDKDEKLKLYQECIETCGEEAILLQAITNLSYLNLSLLKRLSERGCISEDVRQEIGRGIAEAEVMCEQFKIMFETAADGWDEATLKELRFKLDNRKWRDERQRKLREKKGDCDGKSRGIARAVQALNGKVFVS